MRPINSSGSWQTYTIDSSENVGNYSSLAVDSNNKVHISYHDAANGYLKPESCVNDVFKL